MCLILLAYRSIPGKDLVVLANRDEFHARPTRQAGFWENAPSILAGQDLQEGGTWLGVNRSGAFAAVTNYRDPAARVDHARSRGFLVSEFLGGSNGSLSFVDSVLDGTDSYNGFNLLAYDGDSLVWGSNRASEPVGELKPGIYGVSNHLLDTPWPKVVGGKQDLEAQLVRDPDDLDALLNILSDTRTHPVDELPDTGVGPELEQRLSSRCIVGDSYGTRSSTLVMINQEGAITFIERTLIPADRDPDRVRFDFKMKT